MLQQSPHFVDGTQYFLVLRLVEHKRDVVTLLDSITRLARAYNNRPRCGRFQAIKTHAQQEAGAVQLSVNPVYRPPCGVSALRYPLKNTFHSVTINA